MEYEEKGQCALEGNSYLEGVELCDSRRCMRCEDGNWESRFIDDVFGVGP